METGKPDDVFLVKWQLRFFLLGKHQMENRKTETSSEPRGCRTLGPAHHLPRRRMPLVACRSRRLRPQWVILVNQGGCPLPPRSSPLCPVSTGLPVSMVPCPLQIGNLSEPCPEAQVCTANPGRAVLETTTLGVHLRKDFHGAEGLT